MKKIIILLYLVLLLYAAPNVYALTASPSAQPTVSANPDLIKKIDQQINSLKEKIASRVAQLKLVEKRGIIGTVNEVSGTQIKLLDSKNNIRIVDVDEITKFSSSSTKGSFGISDVSKGMLVGVLGNYNKDSQHILARFVTVLTFPKYISGAISSIDNKNFNLYVTTPDNQNVFIDNENITKIYSYTKETDEVKSGFSKLKVGERVMVIGFPDKNDKTHIIASRILRFPAAAINPKIKLSITPTTTDTPTPIKSGPTPSATLKKKTTSAP